MRCLGIPFLGGRGHYPLVPVVSARRHRVRGGLAQALCALSFLARFQSAVALAAESGEPAEPVASEAFSALHANRCAEAIDAFEKVLARAPDNVDARYGRGLSHSCLGEYDAAVEDLQYVAERWPDRADVALNLGSALTSAGAYREAEPWLRRAQADSSLDGPASLLLGLGQLRLGDLDVARTEFERAETRSPALTAQAAYYLGVTEYRAGHFGPAQRYFARVADAQPNSAVGREAAAFLDVLEKRRRDVYRLYGGLGFEYDSNINLAPLDTKVDTTGRKEDGRTLLRAGGAWSPFTNERTRLDLGYSFFQSLYFDSPEYDLQSHEVWGELRHQLDRFLLTLDATYQYYLLTDSSQSFLHQWSTRPAVLVPSLGYGDGELYYRYRGRKFLENEFHDLGIDDAEDLDGDNNAAGLRYIVPLGNRSRSFSVGYQFDRENLRNTGSIVDPRTTEDNQFSYDGHNVLAEVNAELPARIGASLAMTYANRSYSDGSRDVPGGDRRHDDNYTVALTLRRPLGRCFELVGGYLFVDNDSNQQQYRYQRHVAVIALSATY